MRSQGPVRTGMSDRGPRTAGTRPAHRFSPRTLRHPDMVGLITVCGICSYSRERCPGGHPALHR